MTTTIKLRRDTGANWTSANPILALGEPGLDTTANQIKYGDGVTDWANLPYSGGSSTAQWAFNGDTAYNSSNNGLYIQTNQGADDGGAYFPSANEATTTRLYNNSGAGIELSAGANTWIFDITGTVQFPTITTNLHNGGNQSAQTLKFGDPDQQVVITGPTPDANVSAQRIIIQGQRGNGTGEGGDVYLWGGDADIGGGDIKIYAGDADDPTTGYGGYINIEGGRGFDGGGYVRMTAGQSTNGQGADAEVVGGQGGTQGGTANLVGGFGSVSGGDTWVKGGYGAAGSGGNVYINGGASANGAAGGGNIIFTSGTSTWTMDNSGNLTIPSNLVIGANGSGGSSLYQYDAPLQVIGEGANSIMLMGWTANTNAPEDVAVIGFNTPYPNGASNVVIAVGNNSTTVNYWNFDNTGNLSLPGALIGDTPDNDGYLQWVGNSSGDGFGYTTLKLVPDSTLTGGDQYVIIDPTAPNHIHIRAGGTQDNSSAQIFLGGERSHVNVWDNGGVRMQTVTQQTTGTFNLSSLDFSSATINYDGGYGSYVVTINDPNPTCFTAVYGLTNLSYIEAYDGAITYTLTYGGGSSTPGGGPIVFTINETPPSSPIFLQTLYIQNQQDVQSYAEVAGTDFNVDVKDDVRITGSDVVTIRNRSNSEPITIRTDFDGTDKIWSFGAGGNLEVPGNILYTAGASPAPYINGFSSITLNGTGTAINASSGNILTNEVTGTKFNFLNGSYTATITGSGATANYSLNLPANAGSNSQVLSTDGTGNLSWIGDLVQWTTAPVANTSVGTAGQAAYDAGGNLYVCVSSNTWAKFTGTTSW